MQNEFNLTTVFPVNSRQVYRAWLDSDQHSEMTGGAAEVSNVEGNSFTAWDGYIFGKNITLEPYHRIVQSWRTEDFKDSDEDSTLEILLKDTPRGCRLTLIHSNIPDDQPDYKEGWKENYFQPMQEYFEE